MTARSDPWAIQNDWQVRERWNETHDEEGRPRKVGHRAPTIHEPHYWRLAALHTVRDVHEKRLGAIEGLLRLYNYCLHLASMAEGRMPPTEAELLAEAEYVMGDTTARD